MNRAFCDKDVFKYGMSLGLFDMSADQAESYCKAETACTGFKHDWHYVGGRVHIKMLRNLLPLTEERVRAIAREEFHRAQQTPAGAGDGYTFVIG